MPRATEVKAPAILDFFEKASLDNANLVLDSVKAKVAARNRKSTEAKAKAAAPTAVATQPAKTKKKGKKKSTNGAAAPGPVAAPTAPAEQADPSAGEQTA